MRLSRRVDLIDVCNCISVHRTHLDILLILRVGFGSFLGSVSTCRCAQFVSYMSTHIDLVVENVLLCPNLHRRPRLDVLILTILLFLMVTMSWRVFFRGEGFDGRVVCSNLHQGNEGESNQFNLQEQHAHSSSFEMIRQPQFLLKEIR